jgi:hypothetical protein
MNAPHPLSDLGRAALEIASAGWPVFPCEHRLDLPGQKRCKRPLTRCGLKDAVLDPIQIETWWRQWPNALIGVPTGPQIGAFVLDVDIDPEKGVDGAEELTRLEAKNGTLTVESRTPRGGRHLLFRWDPARPITNSSGRLPLGIDVRGQGGYFIVAPSKREDGAAYGWENPPGLFDPVETPAWLWDPITARPEHKAASRVFAFGASSSGRRETAYARAALDGAAREVASAGAGQRNNTLNAIAYRLGRMIARGWLSRDEVEVRLLAAAHENGLVQDDGGFATQRTISSGLDAGMSNPHDELQDDRQFGAAYPKQPASVAVDENGEDDPRPPAFTDEALALRFAERHAGDLRYVAAWGRWLQYDRGRWDFDDTLLAFDRSRKLCREAAAECNRASTASSIASAKIVAAVERLAKADRRLAATIDQWDAQAVKDAQSTQQEKDATENIVIAIDGLIVAKVAELLRKGGQERGGCSA